MKKMIIFCLAVVCLFSCKDDSAEIDLCETVVCANDGVCNNGDCDCPPGFSGTTCEDLEDPIEIKINKIVVYDFPAMNGTEPWDPADGPDLVLSLVIPSAGGGTIVNQSLEIYDCEVGIEYEFILDWKMEGDRLVYRVELTDWDTPPNGSPQDMAIRDVYPMEYRADTPEVIDLPPLAAGNSFGLRLEGLEWIFE